MEDNIVGNRWFDSCPGKLPTRVTFTFWNRVSKLVACSNKSGKVIDFKALSLIDKVNIAKKEFALAIAAQYLTCMLDHLGLLSGVIHRCEADIYSASISVGRFPKRLRRTSIV